MPIDFIKTHLYDGHIQKHNRTLFQDRYLTKKMRLFMSICRISRVRNILVTESPLKVMKNAFCFTLKAL